MDPDKREKSRFLTLGLLVRYYLASSLNSYYLLQGDSDWSEIEVYEAAACVEASQDDQPSAGAQSRVRLRHDLSQERLQHPHRVSPLPPHLRHGRRPAVQRGILLLQRPLHE